MQERRDRSAASSAAGWLLAMSLVLALIAMLLIVSGVFASFMSGYSGGPGSTPFLAAAGCGVGAVLIAAVGWVTAKGRAALRGFLVFAGLIGGLVVLVGARAAYENRAQPLAACRNWDSPPPATSVRADNVLNGVAVTSGSDAWAVGACSATLILHWDGSSWSLQHSPNVGTGYNYLHAVAATSSTDAWAVGEGFPEGGAPYQTLILHWDGSTWRRQPSPNEDEVDNSLNGVAAISPSDAWAVGSWTNGALILHWDGVAWTRDPVPQIAPDIYPSLRGIAATSAADVWAVGSYGGFGEPVRGVVFHWDGTAWATQPIPRVGTGGNVLTAVAATSSSNAWAVGSYEDGTGQHALILHWDGEAWTHEPTPPASTRFDDSLNGVATTSRSNGWAVGIRRRASGPETTLILCWNGTVWKRRPSPNRGQASNILNGVAASESHAWAVGLYGDGTAARTSVASC